ncbi:protein S40-3-like [Salvia miltiorrhiza]|uniref:protein S40-3-like n=1 Tax=Salvia miltiorrhiza TaxID=226208 RepID=UPI0025AC3095|nr:protein S40-3-like [Salvia miltiorrhiza]
MAEEEFQESDVVFRDTDSDETAAAREAPASCRRSKSRLRSVPVNIPASAPRNAWRRCADDGSGGEDGEMVPPHVIVGRRVAGKMMALSICGRILRKGRDLSEFRNLILRMTGFLET